MLLFTNNNYLIRDFGSIFEIGSIIQSFLYKNVKITHNLMGILKVRALVAHAHKKGVWRMVAQRRFELLSLVKMLRSFFVTSERDSIIQFRCTKWELLQQPNTFPLRSLSTFVMRPWLIYKD